MQQSIFTSIVARAISMSSTFLVIPLLLSAMGASDYGVWVTLTSIVGWFLIFDFGLGNAIRNRVAQSQSAGFAQSSDLNLAIAGALQIYTGIAVLLAILVLVAGNFVEPLKSHKLPSALLYFGVIMTFPLSISTSILQGKGAFTQLSALTIILPIGWLIFAAIATLTGWAPDLLLASFVYTGLLLLQNVLTSAIALNGIGVTKAMLADFQNARGAARLIKIGLRFFGLQVCTAVLYYAGNFISFQHLSPSEVARFDTVGKVFLTFTAVLNIVTSVVWTEAAKARAVGDRQRSYQLFVLMLGFASAISVGTGIATAFIAFLSELVSHGQLTASAEEAWPFAAQMSLQSFTFAGAVFLNAHERILGQLMLALLAIPIFLLGANHLFGAGWGISSVPFATSIAIFPSAIYCLTAGYRLIISGAAKREIRHGHNNVL